MQPDIFESADDPALKLFMHPGRVPDIPLRVTEIEDISVRCDRDRIVNCDYFLPARLPDLGFVERWTATDDADGFAFPVSSNSPVSESGWVTFFSCGS